MDRAAWQACLRLYGASAKAQLSCLQQPACSSAPNLASAPARSFSLWLPRHPNPATGHLNCLVKDSTKSIGMPARLSSVFPLLRTRQLQSPIWLPAVQPPYRALSTQRHLQPLEALRAAGKQTAACLQQCSYRPCPRWHACSSFQQVRCFAAGNAGNFLPKPQPMWVDVAVACACAWNIGKLGARRSAFAHYALAFPATACTEACL